MQIAVIKCDCTMRIRQVKHTKVEVGVLDRDASEVRYKYRGLEIQPRKIFCYLPLEYAQRWP